MLKNVGIFVEGIGYQLAHGVERHIGLLTPGLAFNLGPYVKIIFGTGKGYVKQIEVVDTPFEVLRLIVNVVDGVGSYGRRGNGNVGNIIVGVGRRCTPKQIVGTVFSRSQSQQGRNTVLYCRPLDLWMLTT